MQHSNFNSTGVVSATHSNQVQGTIQFIEGRDYIVRGSGSLDLVSGGVGTANFSVAAQSGVGQNIQSGIYVYGIPNAN